MRLSWARPAGVSPQHAGGASKVANGAAGRRRLGRRRGLRPLQRLASGAGEAHLRSLLDFCGPCGTCCASSSSLPAFASAAAASGAAAGAAAGTPAWAQKGGHSVKSEKRTVSRVSASCPVRCNTQNGAMFSRWQLACVDRREALAVARNDENHLSLVRVMHHLAARHPPPLCSELCATERWGVGRSSPLVRGCYEPAERRSTSPRPHAGPRADRRCFSPHAYQQASLSYAQSREMCSRLMSRSAFLGSGAQRTRLSDSRIGVFALCDSASAPRAMLDSASPRKARKANPKCQKNGLHHRATEPANAPRNKQRYMTGTLIPRIGIRASE